MMELTLVLADANKQKHFCSFSTFVVVVVVVASYIFCIPQLLKERGCNSFCVAVHVCICFAFNSDVFFSSCTLYSWFSVLFFLGIVIFGVSLLTGHI